MGTRFNEEQTWQLLKKYAVYSLNGHVVTQLMLIGHITMQYKCWITLILHTFTLYRMYIIGHEESTNSK